MPWSPIGFILVSFSSVAQSCPTLCDPMDCSSLGFPVYHQLLEPTQTHVYRISDAIQPSPLLLLPSIFPSIRVFSNESVLQIRWPKYLDLSFSISPSKEYSGLTSFGNGMKTDLFQSCGHCLVFQICWHILEKGKGTHFSILA